MVVVSYSGKEINAKLVYYGPGLSGKTSNLEYVYQSVPSSNRGKMVSMKTRTERTLFFDFLPVDLGELGGFKTRFLLYTVPGQVYYNATRKLVLRGVDAIIFVADSQRGKMEENIESLQNLHDNLKEYGLSLDEIPMVIQYNKRDLPDVYTIEELNEALNPEGFPVFEAIATTGQGVFETFRGIARILLQKLSKEVKLAPGKGPTSGPAAEPAAPAAPAAAQPAAPSPASEIKLQPISETPAPPTPPVAPGKPFRPGGPKPETPMKVESTPPVGAPEPPAPLKVETTPSISPAEPEMPIQVESTPAVMPPSSPPPPAPEPVNAMSMDSVAETPPPAPPAPPAPPRSKGEDGERSETLAKARRFVPPTASTPVEKKRGFWSRLFGRKEDELPPPPPFPSTAPEGGITETRLASVEIPAVGGSGDASPVYIERRVQVPITLGPDEVARGAKLRLIMEIKVAAAEPGAGADDATKVA